MSEQSVAPIVARLQAALDEARTAGDAIAVLLVNCKGIERVDALQGYHAGDRMASAIEQRLRSEALRKRDLVEPVSRNEFACVLRPSPSEGVALLAAHRIHALLAPGVPLGAGLAPSETSIGIALFPDHGADAETILQKAKIAQRLALEQRERTSVYVQTDKGPRGATGEHEARLRVALQNNGLSLAFQPQLDLRSGRLCGAEALLRWRDEVLGEVPAYRAIAAAEAAGLVDEVAFWGLTAALQKCAEFRRIDPGFSVSVNISPSTLREPDLPAFIDRALRTWRVPAANLIVEITETAMLADPKAANEALREMRSYGVRLSVDDFGTGYSSMLYLAELPLEELKIDLMFVRDMLSVPVHAKIVRSLIDLAHNLELTVVAEGVETQDIEDALRHLGCDRVQGYHIAKPMSAADLLVRLKATPPRAKGD